MVRHPGLRRKCKRRNNLEDDLGESFINGCGCQQFRAYGHASIFEFWTSFMIHLSPFAFTAVVGLILSSLPMADAAPPTMQPSALNVCVAVSAVVGAGIAAAVAIADSTTAAPEFMPEIPLPEVALNVRAPTAPALQTQTVRTTRELAFAKCLKETDESGHVDDSGEAVEVVTGFDFYLLKKTCLKSSPDYDTRIDMNELTRILFCPNQWWQNRKVLFDAVFAVGGCCGFKPSKNRNTIHCNRLGQKVYRRNYNNSGLHVNCTFILYLKTLFKIPNRVTNPSDPNNNRNNRVKAVDDWSRETCVLEESAKKLPSC